MNFAFFIAKTDQIFNETGKSFWLPIKASSFAGEVDAIFYFILALSVIFFVGVVATLVAFIFKYKRKGDADRTSPVSHNLRLEVVWTLIPTVLVFVIFFVSFKLWMKMNIIPSDSINIKATAQKWSWSFEYPNGGKTGNSRGLVVPVGKTIKLTMISKDVLHSFFVPSFRVKRDVLPGRYSVVWFKPTKIGNYSLFCAEYCGTDHSRMISKVSVVAPEDFDKETIQNKSDFKDVVAWGKHLFEETYGCTSCHSVKVGVAGANAPSLAGIWGKSGEVLVNGSSKNVTKDINYFRESILNPNAKIVKGYSSGVMPTFTSMSEDDLSSILRYLEKLGK